MNLQEMLKELNANYMPTSEAAKVLSDATQEKVNSGHIRRLVKSEKVEALDVAGKLYISKASIAKLVSSGWTPGERAKVDREFQCFNIWLSRSASTTEIGAINKALGRDVKVEPRKYYHKRS